MSVVELAGVFQLVLPQGWTKVDAPGDVLVLAAPEGRDLAVLISVYPRSTPAFAGRSAVELVRDLAVSQAGVDPDRQAVIAPEEDGQERAFTSFRSEEGWCFAGFLLFPGGLVVATATSGTLEERAEGEALVVAIAPWVKQRRWWSRRT